MASMPPTAGGKFQVSNRRFTMEGKVQKRGGGVKIACADAMAVFQRVLRDLSGDCG
jgi:hypothetical protein